MSDAVDRLRKLRDEAQAELDKLGVSDDPEPPTDQQMMREASSDPGHRQAIVRDSITAKRRAFHERFEVDNQGRLHERTGGEAA